MRQNFKTLDGDLLLTTACVVECDFCVYSCTPDGKWMPEETIRNVAREYTKHDIGIRICGGEPFLDLQKLEKCLKIVLEYQKPYEILIITSGFFAKDKTETKKNLELLSKYDLDTLVVSTDRFHLKSVPLNNITNILEEAKKLNLRIILRITIDSRSDGFISDIVKLIAEHNANIEMHYDWGVLGKAELLKDEADFSKKVKKKFISKLKEASRQYGKGGIGHHFVRSPKRSQRDFGAKFFPTAFPHGDVYGDSLCCKGTFMGNIDKESLTNMIERFKKTLPGFVLYSKEKKCDYIRELLPPLHEDVCTYCRNYPLEEKISENAIGRRFVKLKPSRLDDAIKNLNDIKKELLLSFELKEQELTLLTGKKILRFLQKLEDKKIRFRMSRPLPKCLFSAKHQEVVRKYNIPRNCFECDMLFTVRDGRFVSCQYIGVKGHELDLSLNRSHIWSLFDDARLKKKPLDRCKKCKYFIRRNCDGLCFRT